MPGEHQSANSFYKIKYIFVQVRLFPKVSLQFSFSHIQFQHSICHLHVMDISCCENILETGTKQHKIKRYTIL